MGGRRGVLHELERAERDRQRAVVKVDLTQRPLITCRALAAKAVDIVDAGPAVLARVGVALIEVEGTGHAPIAGHTGAGVGVDVVDAARAVFTWGLMTEQRAQCSGT